MISLDQAQEWARELPFMTLREAGLDWDEIADLLNITERQARTAAGIAR